MKSFLSFSVSCTIISHTIVSVDGSFSNNDGELQELTLPSSCTNLKNGVHYVKPSVDGAIIPVVCDDGYTILNLVLDFDGVSSHFTSFYQYNWNADGIYSGDCEMASEESSWREWLIPATIGTKFRVSPDCMSCEASPSYGDNTGYYMTNYYFCWNKHHDWACEVDEAELATRTDLSYDVTDDTISMCNVCDDSLRRLTGCDGNWCDCMSLRLDADTVTSDDHDNCVQKRSVVVKPSIANDGKHCTCYQQSDSDDTIDSSYVINFSNDEDLKTLLPALPQKFYKQYKDDGIYIDGLISKIMGDEDDDEDDEDDEDELISSGKITAKSKAIKQATDDDCSLNRYLLSNNDFKEGTYRIQECGTYLLTEDIVINFNGPSENDMNDEMWSPNDYNLDNYPWYPQLEQQNEDEYPGLSQMRGTYQAGFWAGITIETDDVTLNLNGFKIEMDYTYYVQQRFFALIALGNRPFISDQGPANFGRQRYSKTSNIVIKNGELGRTSHQGIHGNQATNLVIKDIKVSNFDVTGIQCNGCSHVLVSDSVIGPQSDDIPVLGKYTHGRALLPRLKYFVENYGDQSVTFGGDSGDIKRTVTIEELADELVEQMDMIYYHVINGVEYDENDEQWMKAKALFLNPSGYMDGGSSYGLFFNGQGTGVVAFGRRKEGPGSDITVRNVEIFGIQNQPWEKFWTTYHGSSEMQGFFFDPLDWVNILDADNNNLYKGDAYHDLVFAAGKVASYSEFCLFNTIFVSPVLDWVFEGDTDLLSNIEYHCGSDVQSHDAKGTMAFRSDATNGLTVEDLYIHDISNYGELATDYLCGEWDMISFVSKTYKLIEPGYTGTRAHGILMSFTEVNHFKNIQIDNIRSQYGSAIAASIYQGSSVHTLENIGIMNINAGWGLTSDDVESLASQNQAPRACSFELGEGDESYPVTITHNGVKDDTIVGASIFGYDICSDGQRIGMVHDDIKTVQTLIKTFANGNVGNVEETVWTRFMHKSVFYVAMITITFCILLFLFIVKTKMKDIINWKNEKINNNNRNESSPLLVINSEDKFAYTVL